MSRFSHLSLVAVGDSPFLPMQEMADDLEEILGLSVSVLTSRLPLPDDAWDHRRGQYLAPRILSLLRQARGASEGLVLGVANSDLYAPGLSFVFGQADMANGVAAVSMTRLFPAYYGRPHDVTTFRRRNAIEGVHEVGHLLGIPHCPDRHCVMFFSSTMSDSDRKGPLFCETCGDRAARAVVRTPAVIPAAADGPIAG